MSNRRGTRLAVVLPHTAEMDDALMVRRVEELILTGERGEASALLDSIPEVDRVAPPAPQTVTREKVLRERDRRNLSAAQKFAVHERRSLRSRSTPSAAGGYASGQRRAQVRAEGFCVSE